MIHRRFGGMFEFDRNGFPLSGTFEQQAAVRAAITDNIEYGNRFWQVLRACDREINRQGRNYIPVGFFPLHEQDLVGFCFPYYLQLGEQLAPTRQAVGAVFLHELGHLVGWKLKPWHGGTDTHGMNEAFKDWVLAGQPDGLMWDQLSPHV